MTTKRVRTWHSILLHLFPRIFVAFLLPRVVTTEGDKLVTVNSESVLEVMTSRITKIESKLDLLLMAAEAQNSQKDRFDPITENHICSMSARVIKLENEIDALKTSSNWVSNNIFSATSEKSFPLISGLHLKLASVQKSLKVQEAQTVELEKRVSQIQNFTYVLLPEDEVKTDSDICNLRDLDIKDLGRKPLLHYLQSIDFNVFLRKPSNASSLHKDNYKILYGVDGDKSTWYASNAESNPWFFVDLLVPHYIWEITLVIRELQRAAGIKIYLANNVPVDYYGQPDVKRLPQFASHTGKSVSLTLVFTNPGGICGRYVVVIREVEKDHLIFSELQGVGYAFK